MTSAKLLQKLSAKLFSGLASRDGRYSCIIIMLDASESVDKKLPDKAYVVTAGMYPQTVLTTLRYQLDFFDKNRDALQRVCGIGDPLNN